MDFAFPTLIHFRDGDDDHRIHGGCSIIAGGKRENDRQRDLSDTFEYVLFNSS